MSAAAILIPILAQIGAPVAKTIIERALGGDTLAGSAAKTVVDTIAGQLGVPKTPEAIRDAYEKCPEDISEAIRVIEDKHSEAWLALLTQGLAARDELLKREDEKGFFHSGWRPAMCWLLVWMWLQNVTVFPVLNAVFGAALALTPWEQLVAFGSVWLVIYGGGHTAKSIWGRD